MAEVPDELAALVRFPAELRGVEYRREVNWDDPNHRAKFARTAMAMSNLTDGGYIVVGVEENPKGNFTSIGVSEPALSALQPDLVSEFVNGYADPPVLIEARSGDVDGLRYWVVDIRPFRELPTVCKKTGGSSGELRAGAVYVRSIRKRESVPVGSQDEMRELIDRAVDTQIEKLRRRFPEFFGVPLPQRGPRAELNDELGAFL